MFDKKVLLLAGLFLGVRSLIGAAAFDINRLDKGLSPLAPLHKAAHEGSLEGVRFLLKQPGIIVDLKSGVYQKTPLHFAAEAGHLAIIDLLLTAGHPVDARASDGCTALHYVCLSVEDESVKIACIKRLLDAHADVNAPNNEGSTPLHFCGGKLTTTLLDYLIHAGANLLAVDKNGKNVLHKVTRYGHVTVVKKLIELGVPFNVSNSPMWEAMNALELCYEHNKYVPKDRKDVVEAFIAVGQLVPSNMVDRLSRVGISVPRYQVIDAVVCVAQPTIRSNDYCCIV